MTLKITKYKDRIDAYNYGQKDYYIEQNKQLILRNFTTHPSYQSVKINSIDRDVHIVDDNTLDKDPNKKIMLVKPDETASVGDYIEWDNYNWLVINIDNNKDVQHRCELYRCNGRLNWIDSSGKINSYWCVRQELSKASSGTSENKYIIVPDRLNNILVQANAYTNNLRERDGTRFIFGEKSFLLHDTDRELRDGLVVITTEEDEINFDTDKLVDVNGVDLWIANYTEAPVYLLNIDQDDSEIVDGNTLQLSAQVTKDGQVVSEGVAWSSSNELIATVDNTGLVTSVTTGSVVITATMVNNGDVADTINIDVVAVANDNYSIQLTPDSTDITLSVKLDVNAKLLNNGVDTTDTFSFSVVGGTASASDYEFTVIDGNNYSIKNINDGGTVIVRSTSGIHSVDKTYKLNYYF